jgi:hypothetical protein
MQHCGDFKYLMDYVKKRKFDSLNWFGVLFRVRILNLVKLRVLFGVRILNLGLIRVLSGIQILNFG